MQYKLTVIVEPPSDDKCLDADYVPCLFYDEEDEYCYAYNDGIDDDNRLSICKSNEKKQLLAKEIEEEKRHHPKLEKLSAWQGIMVYDKKGKEYTGTVTVVMKDKVGISDIMPNSCVWFDRYTGLTAGEGFSVDER